MIQISSFSQTSYPKKILWEGDTVVAITVPQLVRINRSLNNYVYLKKINRNLQTDLALSDSLRLYWKQVAAKSDTLSTMEKRKFGNISKLNEILKSDIEKEKKKNKKKRVGVGVGCTLAGILLGALLAR